VKIDAPLLPGSLAQSGAAAQRLEGLGYDGAFTFEGPNDPFFPLVLAAAATERLELGTAVAIAFARNPMLLANIGHDLQVLSRGRFRLGLGSQIRPHVERRFSAAWSKPAARMRELVLAIRAIWRAWNEGEKLDFRGDFYTHTLMTPFFDPGPSPYGPPRILLAGVGPRMTEVAGEVGDGFIVHPFHTPESLRSVTLPALERGCASASRSFDDLEISCQLLVVSGRDDGERERARAAVKSQIAFYGSTPAYRGVLECHGWGDLQTELHRLSRRGRWQEMAACIDDDVLETMAVCGREDELADRIRARCADLAQRVSLVAPWSPDPERFAKLRGTLSGTRPLRG
jgi:probable F420-dependent oxidoreductase